MSGSGIAGQGGSLQNQAGRAVPVQERARETYESIINVCAKLAVERGVETVTVRDIVAYAGVSKGAFYNYFNGVDELIGEIRSRIRVDYLNYLGQYFGRIKCDTLREVIVELAGWYTEYLRVDPLAKALFLARGLDIGSAEQDGPEWEQRRPWRAIVGYLEFNGFIDSPASDDVVLWCEILFCQIEVVLDLAFRKHPQGDTETLKKLDLIIDSYVGFIAGSESSVPAI